MQLDTTPATEPGRCPRAWHIMNLNDTQEVCVVNWTNEPDPEGFCPPNTKKVAENLALCQKEEWVQAEFEEIVPDPTACPHMWEFNEFYGACIPFWVTTKDINGTCLSGSVINENLEPPQICIIENFTRDNFPMLFIDNDGGSFADP